MHYVHNFRQHSIFAGWPGGEYLEGRNGSFSSFGLYFGATTKKSKLFIEEKSAPSEKIMATLRLPENKSCGRPWLCAIESLMMTVITTMITMDNNNDHYPDYWSLQLDPFFVILNPKTYVLCLKNIKNK